MFRIDAIRERRGRVFCNGCGMVVNEREYYRVMRDGEDDPDAVRCAHPTARCLAKCIMNITGGACGEKPPTSNRGAK